jgi:hypothetical protein
MPSAQSAAKTKLSQSTIQSKGAKIVSSNSKSKSKGKTKEESQSQMGVAERLLESHKKTQAKLEAQQLERRKQEEAMLQQRLGMSSGSKKILQSRGQQPIHSMERIQQIVSSKKAKLDRLKEELTAQRLRAEEEELAKSTPSYKGQDIKDVELCYDPQSIRPVVYEANSKSRIESESTEDQELRNCCSFHPQTNQQSKRIFSKVRLELPVDKREQQGSGGPSHRLWEDAQPIAR